MEIIMINDQDEWGNIQLPGLSDEELYARNWNRVAASQDSSQRLAQDPEYIEKLRQGQQQALANPKTVQARQQAQRRAGETKRNSSEYQQVMDQVNKKKAQKPDFAENVRQGALKKLQDPEYQAKRAANAQAQCWTITDSQGQTWLGAGRAAEHWFPDISKHAGSRKIRHLCNTPGSGWSKTPPQSLKNNKKSLKIDQ
jgi:hypothetical protein